MSRKHEAQHIWRYGEIDVIYAPDVDGGGARMVEPLIDFMHMRFGAQRRFGTVFEWCAGTGFIGFGLLAEDLCDSLCFADVSPKAISCVRSTIAANNLQDRTRAYVSDNMSAIPMHERFDLVVGNPPSFYATNPTHPLYAFLDGDIRSNDPDWKIHSSFYRQIAQFLNPQAYVLALEVNLHEREVFTPGCSIPLDIRPEKPQLTFAGLIREGGLTHVENTAIDPSWNIGFNFCVQVSQK